jgi:hypothetical protein
MRQALLQQQQAEAQARTVLHTGSNGVSGGPGGASYIHLQLQLWQEQQRQLEQQKLRLQQQLALSVPGKLESGDAGLSSLLAFYPGLPASLAGAGRALLGTADGRLGDGLLSNTHG